MKFLVYVSNTFQNSNRNCALLNSFFLLVTMYNLTRITLTHNKISAVPPALANLNNLEILNLFNNQITELPTSLSSMPKLRILNLGWKFSTRSLPTLHLTYLLFVFYHRMNKLNALPRGFGAFPVLEVLDLTYNNLNESSLPGNFFMIESLRALYLGDNDFERIPAEIGNLKNLQIVIISKQNMLDYFSWQVIFVWKIFSLFYVTMIWSSCPKKSANSSDWENCTFKAIVFRCFHQKSVKK